jgi:chromosome segregation ATPase
LFLLACEVFPQEFPRQIEVQDSLEDSEKQIKSLQNSMETVQTAMKKNIENIVREHNTRVDDLKYEHGKYSKNLKEQFEERQTKTELVHQNVISDLKTEHESNVSILSKDKNVLESEISHLQSRISFLEEEEKQACIVEENILKTSNAEVDMWKARTNELSKDHANYQSTIKTLQGQCKEHLSSISKLKDELKSMETERNTVRGEMAKSHERMELMKFQHEDELKKAVEHAKQYEDKLVEIEKHNHELSEKSVFELQGLR